MGKRKDKIEQKYGEYTMKFAGKSKEEMEASIDNLTKQIEEKNNVLKKTKDKDEREKLESIIKKMEQEKNNMSGYSKNKEKIEKIRAYKAKLSEKIEPLKQEKSNLEKQLKIHTEANKDALDYINKTLKDTKTTENMSNEAYNNLLVEKENIEKEREEIQKKIDNVQKKIDALARGTSKCDLAWRSLFNDKSWDEIQVRAMNTKYTRKVKETKQNESKNEESKTETKTTYTSKETRKQDNNDNVKNDEEKGIIKASKFAEKHPRLSKFFNWCKKGLNKVGEFFKDESFDSEEHNSNAQDNKEKKQENNGERDAFIEELRRHVENDKSDKEAAYIEKHKAKVKTPEEAERD